MRGRTICRQLSLILLCANGVATAATGVRAVPANDFLNSIGTISAISRRGENLEKTIDCTKYLGVRWLRAGIEGNVPIQHFVQLHEKVGLRFSWGLGSGGADLRKLIESARQIAAAGALLAFEGPNEPNNWGITYQEQTGGRKGTWMPVAKLQRDLYQAVKSDPALNTYPVWSISEGGAETDNVGLQFLTIPAGADTLMPPARPMPTTPTCIITFITRTLPVWRRTKRGERQTPLRRAKSMDFMSSTGGHGRIITRATLKPNS